GGGARAGPGPGPGAGAGPGAGGGGLVAAGQDRGEDAVGQERGGRREIAVGEGAADREPDALLVEVDVDAGGEVGDQAGLAHPAAQEQDAVAEAGAQILDPEVQDRGLAEGEEAVEVGLLHPEGRAARAGPVALERLGAVGQIDRQAQVGDLELEAVEVQPAEEGALPEGELAAAAGQAEREAEPSGALAPAVASACERGRHRSSFPARHYNGRAAPGTREYHPNSRTCAAPRPLGEGRSEPALRALTRRPAAGRTGARRRRGPGPRRRGAGRCATAPGRCGRRTPR